MEVYTDKKLADDLEAMINQRYKVDEIAKWAHQIYLSFDENFSPLGKDVLMQLIAMDEGEDFEMTYDELKETILQLRSS